MRYITVFVLLFLLFIAPVYAAKGTVSRIDIEGNDIVSDATVISKIKIRAGQEYNENVINEDVKNLYATGFFEIVEVEKQTPTRDEVVVIFIITEKPVLKSLRIEGARHIHRKKILQAIDVTEGSFVDEYKLKEATRKIRDLYTNKGFSQADVSYEMDVNKDKNEIDVTFIIDERRVIKVRKVTVQGNFTFSDRKIIRLMKTRKAWWLNRGVYKEEVLKDDIKRIRDFYKREGFSDVQVDTDLRFKQKGVYITILINEGSRYYVGSVKIQGNEAISTEELKKSIPVKPGVVFSEQAIYESSSDIRQEYVDDGYIFAQIEPFSSFNPQTQNVDVSFKIVENDVYYVENIDIKGNIKTKDKIIRRELRIYPGDRFDGSKIRKSKERLENLGFFEGIRFGTDPATEPKHVDLVVDVKEAKTGYLSFGGGYSSVDEFVGFIELRQRNFDYKNWKTFTGAGQDLRLEASFGTVTDNYQLSFTNPWIFDKPYSFGFDGYSRSHDRNDDAGYGYQEEIKGGALRLGHEFNDRVKAGIAYRFENVKIGDVPSDATQALKNEIGENNLSSIEIGFTYDTRDNVFVPSRGFYFSDAFDITGGPMGGDKDFIKDYMDARYYIPMPQKAVIEVRGRTGWADPFDNTNTVPIYDRFFAGGANSIRGYDERKVGPFDPVTKDPIGGEAMFVGNIEYTYPLIDFIKVATFFDVGNVWAKNSDFMSGDLYKSVGFGLRVKTPIGPVSVDYGWPLDTQPGESEKSSGKFHFSVSRGF